MNILITTFSLLLVLAVSSTLFWKETISSSQAFQASKGYFEARRIAQNRAEQKRFQRWKEANSSTVSNYLKKPSSYSRKKGYSSHRNKLPPLEQGRLHIAPLWESEYRLLFQPVLERLLTDLYGHASWFDQRKVIRLIEALASTDKEFDQTSFGETLDKELYVIWHPMIRGTQIYDTENKKGYPPLKDYIDFSSATIKHTCHFPFASLPILRAIFGKEITLKIQEVEQAKWEENHRHRFCLKKELLPYLHINKQSSQLIGFVETFLYFSQSIGKRSFEQGKDEKSQISHRCEIEIKGDGGEGKW
jgi:hypothetical protein